MEYDNYHDQVGFRAGSITAGYTLAINGAFFATRSAGKTPTQSEKNRSSNDIQYAHFAFSNTLMSLIDEIQTRNGLSPAGHLAANKIAAMRVELTKQISDIGKELSDKGSKAIRSGHGHKAAALLSQTNAGHGAIGQLVQAKLARGVELTTRDRAGREWKSPSSLMRTIFRDFAYQSYVETKLQEASLTGQDAVNITDGLTVTKISLTQNDEGLPYIGDVREKMFHVNSNAVFES